MPFIQNQLIVEIDPNAIIGVWIEAIKPIIKLDSLCPAHSKVITR